MLATAQDFYGNLGAMAREKSVSVSVCTIKGAESRLLELGRVAEISGGQVYNVTLFGHWINIMNLAVLQPVY